MFPHISDNFFHHLKLSLLWPTLFCGPHYDNCQVLPHSPQHKNYNTSTPTLQSSRLQSFLDTFILPDNQHLPPNPSRAFKILFVFNLQKFSHITLLRSLHWLPISARIQLETPFLAHTAANCPLYLHAFIWLCVSPHEGFLPVQLQKLLHSCFWLSHSIKRELLHFHNIKLLRRTFGLKISSKHNIQCWSFDKSFCLLLNQ